ncbi:flagellar hook-associated protein FlgK [Pararhodospirillum oryzae]|uniref:Flagellar hook-associated protein 1 n=1 Tax=Pararhodospirillum oryzae TaxID=478448 RepID=A0A512H8K0_9PROT|nr:flagellar hook-associated protein FlgK [Pararhodospirillum oryzae]GEO81785.1 flagellar hook-associated protein FlgK [Pararhodospirillum oryzae]
MSLNLTLTTAVSGLQTAQKGLNVVSNNLMNVNTVGYTRKTFSPESVVLNGAGAGVQTGGIIRSVNESLNQEVRSESSRLSYLSTQQTYYQRMQDLFGTPAANTSLSHRITAFAQQFEALALEPDSSTQQLSVARTAENLAAKFNSLSRELQDMRLNAEQDIAQAVDDINTHLRNIDTLNNEIALGTATGTDVTTQKDKRDQELKSLNELIEVSSFERSGGGLVIYTKAGVNLMDIEPVTVTHSALSSMTATESYAGSDVLGIKAGVFDVTPELAGGKLGALIEMRDNTLVDAQAQLDELAVKMRDTLNQVNNRGTSYPSVSNTFNGTTKFIDPAASTITLSGGDTVVALFNPDGSEMAKTNLSTLMGGATQTVGNTMTALNNWLNTEFGTAAVNYVTLDSQTNTYSIDLQSNTVSLAFRDQASSTAGATAQDVSIGYNVDGLGGVDQTVSGFSNFMGFNDLYVTDGKQWVFDSGVKAENWRANATGTLVFSDDTGASGTLPVTANMTLQDMAKAINAEPTLSAFVEAEVVPEGDGYRLRVKNRAGNDMEVFQQGGAGSLMTNLGMGVSNAGASAALEVNPNVLSDPTRLSRGAVLYNPDTSEYYLSAGDNTTANQMAAAFQSNVTFTNAGGLTAGQRTLSDYAALSLSQNASNASSVKSEASYQADLVDALTSKQAEVSGVNMDEEISQLLIWEQMYNAAAKVISVTADMLDVLNSIIR